MTTDLNIELWHRRQVFEFFKGYDKPFFNVCANLDVTALVNLARSDKNCSFTFAYHFLSLKTANELEPFRYRLRGGGVVIHDRIHGGSTVLLPDQSFRFYHFEFHEDFARFQREAQAALNNARTVSDSIGHQANRDDLIYYSVLPWISFTSFSHARQSDPNDSIPKIVFGKYFHEGESIKMPVSVEVHHALMDGVHVGAYFEKLAGYFLDPQAVLGDRNAKGELRNSKC